MSKFFRRKSRETPIVTPNDSRDDAVSMTSTQQFKAGPGVYLGRLSDVTEQGENPLEAKRKDRAKSMARRQTTEQLIGRLRRENTRWLEALLEADNTSISEIMSTKRLEESPHKLGNFTLSAMESEYAHDILTEEIDVVAAAIVFKQGNTVTKLHSA